MKKLSFENLNRREKIYAAILLLGVLAVAVRIVLVQMDRGRQITSFVSEWNRNGKPVIVKEMKAVDVPVYTKFTVIRGQDRTADGFVTGDIKDKFEHGQTLFSAGGGAPCGVILSIGQEIDMETGMFPVKVELNDLSSPPGSRLILFAQTQTLKNACVVPNDVLDTSQGVSYAWKIEDGKARKIKVVIGSRNGYGTAIAEGVRSGDLIVINGQDGLSENDKVNIVARAEVIKQ